MELRKDHVRYYLHDSFIQKMPELYRWLSVKTNFVFLEKRCWRNPRRCTAKATPYCKKIGTLSDAQLGQDAVALSDALYRPVGWGLLPPLIDFWGEHISKAALSAIQTQILERGLSGHALSILPL